MTMCRRAQGSRVEVGSNRHHIRSYLRTVLETYLDEFTRDLDLTYYPG